MRLEDIVSAVQDEWKMGGLGPETLYGEFAIEVAKRASQETRAKVIGVCRAVVLSCSEDAHEAAKAKDATDYVAGYQDAVVDCDEALRELLQENAS